MDLAIVYTAFVLLFALLLRIWWPNRPHHHKNLPPGSPGWPFIGEMLAFYRSLCSSHPQTFNEVRFARCGSKLFRTHLYGNDTIASVDPDFNRFVFLNDGKLVHTHSPKSLGAMLGEWNLLDIRGAMHKRLHAVALGLMTPDKLRENFLADMDTCAQRALKSWRNKDVLVEQEIKHFSLGLIAKQLLSLGEGEETQALATNFTKLMKGLLSLPLNTPGTVYSQGLRARKKLVKMISDIISQRRKQPRNVYNDLLGRLMACEEDPLSTPQLIDFLLFLAFAAHETTSNLIASAIKYLTDCPLALQQMREEHDAVKNRRTAARFTWEDYKSLTFTQNVITETLRLTVTASHILRVAIVDIEYNGYTIPKGWNIVALSLGCCYDADVYSEPMKFNPWRWEGDKLNPQRLLSFGAGARTCTGSELAKLEATVFLHHFITNFDWKLSRQDSLCWFPLSHFRHHLPMSIWDRCDVCNFE